MNEISVYPNPCHDKGTLLVESSVSIDVTIEIFNISGKKFMLISNTQMITASNIIDLAAGEFEKNFYFAKIYSALYSTIISFQKTLF